MRRRLLPLLLLAALPAGCGPASTYRPKVDLAGVDPARYEIDRYDCKKVAERDRYGPVLAGAILGAGVGGAVATAAYGGGVGLATSQGTLSGLAVGTAAGAGKVPPPIDEKAFVDQCLRNNGYKVE
jgi:hypothetical protein